MFGVLIGNVFSSIAVFFICYIILVGIFAFVYLIGSENRIDRDMLTQQSKSWVKLSFQLAIIYYICICGFDFARLIKGF